MSGSEEQRLTISIAMATYNGAKYIREQLDDLAAQILLPTELVVCDDQSSDETISIVREFAALAPFPVRIHRNPERLGYRANFIKCAGLCSSDLIAFCDQDDRWAREKLQLSAQCFADPSILLIYHNARVVSERNADMGPLYAAKSDRIIEPLEIDPWFVALGFTQVFRRSLLFADDLFVRSVDQNVTDKPLAHDQWYFFLASVLGRMVYISDPLASYRQHDGNTTLWNRPTLLSRLWDKIRGALTGSISRRAAGAGSRAAILAAASMRLDADAQFRLQAAQNFYSNAAVMFRLRAKMHKEPRLKMRCSLLAKLWRTGAYSTDQRGTPLLAFVIDALLGLTGFLRHLIRNVS